MTATMEGKPLGLRAAGSPFLLWGGAALAALGLVDSAYLLWVKLRGGPLACAGIGDCDLVNSSRFSEVAGIPVAALGAMAYTLLLGMLAAEALRPAWSTGLRLATFGLTLAGVLYSAYLTYIEFAVLEAICPFCVISAAAMAGLFLVACLRLRPSEPVS